MVHFRSLALLALAIASVQGAADPATQRANGKAARELNAKFASLSATSPCKDGEQACVQGSFAQCVGGKFQLSGCAGGTVCKALPLVNKAGTSIACDTEADANARIAAAEGAKRRSLNKRAADAATQQANGKAARALNAKFAKVQAGSACNGGEATCAGDKFAQCVGGKLQASACAGGLVCRALPLVNKAGTSVTCDTQADADARIKAAEGAKRRRSLSRRAADSATQRKNGADAKALNAKSASIKAGSSCTGGEVVCAGSAVGQCSNGKIVTTPCNGGLVCKTLPLVNKAGTSVACDTEADATARINAALNA